MMLNFNFMKEQFDSTYQKIKAKYGRGDNSSVVKGELGIAWRGLRESNQLADKPFEDVKQPETLKNAKLLDDEIDCMKKLLKQI